MTRRAVIVVAALVLLALVPLWWWALFGMSEDVATAWFITDAVATTTAVFAWIFGDDQ